MNIWHSTGEVAVLGTICFMRGKRRSRRSMACCASAMRGSSACVAVSGGGQGRMPSQLRITRTAGSSASSIDSADEPVRGSPRPISGATICCSSISGWRRYQSSTCSRCDSNSTSCAKKAARPAGVKRASRVADATRIPSPSRNESSPKSSSPVALRACASSSATPVMQPPPHTRRALLSRGAGRHHKGQHQAAAIGAPGRAQPIAPGAV